MNVQLTPLGVQYLSELSVERGGQKTVDDTLDKEERWLNRDYLSQLSRDTSPRNSSLIFPPSLSLRIYVTMLDVGSTMRADIEMYVNKKSITKKKRNPSGPATQPTQ